MKKLLPIVLLIGLLQSCTNDPQTLTNTPIYTLPDLNSEIKETLPKNTDVRLTFQAQDWCRIVYQEIAGYTPCSKIDLPELPQGELTGKTIIVDPGHGGKDNGAIVNTIKEKDINRAVSRFLVEDLQKEGAIVVVTRQEDETLYLYNRPIITNLVVLAKSYLNSNNDREKASIANLIVSLEQVLGDNREVIPYLFRKTGEMNEDLKMIFELTNQIDDTLFLSIHSNVKGGSIVDLEGLDIILTGNNVATQYPGYDIFNEEERLRLGNLLGKEISTTVPINLRRVYFGDYAVLREQNLPSALIELGYMDNEENLKLLTTPESQKRYAEGITNAVIQFFEESK